MTNNDKFEQLLGDVVRAAISFGCAIEGHLAKQDDMNAKKKALRAHHAETVAALQERTGAVQPSAVDVDLHTSHAEADRIISRLNSSDPDFDDCADAAALIYKLVAEHKGPEGFATWKDAAIAERKKRLVAIQPEPVSKGDDARFLPCPFCNQAMSNEVESLPEFQPIRRCNECGAKSGVTGWNQRAHVATLTKGEK